MRGEVTTKHTRPEIIYYLSGCNGHTPSSLLSPGCPQQELTPPFPPKFQVLGLALAQHERVVTQALAAQQQSSALNEGLMKQHARLGGGGAVRGMVASVSRTSPLSLPASTGC